jgi:hypothetical protein
MSYPPRYSYPDVNVGVTTVVLLELSMPTLARLARIPLPWAMMQSGR